MRSKIRDKDEKITVVKKTSKILLTSNIPGFSVDEVFHFAKDVGFDGIEYVLSLRDLVHPPSKVLLASRTYSLPIMSLHQPLLSLLYTSNVMLKRIVEASEKFTDAELLVVHLSAFVSFFKDNTQSLKRVLEHTRLKYTVENNDNLLPFRFYPKKTYMPDSFSIFCLKKKLPMTIDTSHISSLGGDIVSFFKNNQKSINHIQLSDAGYNKKHLLFGEGVLPLLQFFQTVAESEYDRFITFEVRESIYKRSKHEFLKEMRKNLILARKRLSR